MKSHMIASTLVNTTISALPSLVRTRSLLPITGDDAYFSELYDCWRQKRGGSIKIWSDTIWKDFERIEEPVIYELRQWNKMEWLLLLLAMIEHLGCVLPL